MGLHFLNLSPIHWSSWSLASQKKPKVGLFKTGQSQSTVVCSESTGLQNAEKCPGFLQSICLSHWHVVLVGGDQTHFVGKQRENPEEALHPIAGHLTQVWVPLDANHAEGGAVLFLPWWPLGSPKQGSASGV